MDPRWDLFIRRFLGRHKRREIYMAEEDKTDTTRTEEAEVSRVGKLDPDDPLAGTIDDPNIQDPYAHLRSGKAGGELPYFEQEPAER